MSKYSDLFLDEPKELTSKYAELFLDGPKVRKPPVDPQPLVTKPWLTGAMEKGEDFAYNIMRDVPGFGVSFPMMGVPPPLRDVAGLIGKATDPIREKIEGLSFLAPLRDLEERAFGEKAIGEPLFEPEVLPQSQQEQVYNILKPILTGEVSVPEAALGVAESTPVVGAVPRAIRDPESLIERPLPYLMDLAILLGGTGALARGKKGTIKPVEPRAELPDIFPGLREKVVPEIAPGPPEGVMETIFGLEKPKVKPKKIVVGKKELALKKKLKAEGVGGVVEAELTPSLIGAKETPVVERYLTNPNLDKASRLRIAQKYRDVKEVTVHLEKPLSQTGLDDFVHLIKSQLPKRQIGFREQAFGLNPIVIQKVMGDGTAKIYFNLNQASRAAKDAGFDVNFNAEIVRALKGESGTMAPKGKVLPVPAGKGLTPYLNEKINYGGEIRTRGSVIAEMQKQGTAQKQIDAYMVGAKTLKPTPKPSPGKAAGKQPWEMTREEFAQSNLDRILEISKEQRSLAQSYGAMGSELVNVKLMNRTAKTIEKLAKEKAGYSDPNWIKRQHKSSVKQAILDKKPVPEAVLAEYPELKAKAEPKVITATAKKITPKNYGDWVDSKWDVVRTTSDYKKAVGALEEVYHKAASRGDIKGTKEVIDHLSDYLARQIPKQNKGILGDYMERALGAHQKLLTRLAAKAEYLELGKKGRKVRVTRKKAEPVELGFLGTPEAAKALGESVVSGAKEISRLTSEMTEKMKVKPEIRAGVKEAKEAMIEHDRQTRRAESTSKLFEKVIKDVVPDKGRQMEMVHAYEHKMKGPRWEGLTDLEQSMVEWVAKEKAKLNKFIEKNNILEMMPESENINHIFHHWIDPKTGNPYKGMYGKFSKGLPQAKQRVIPTYESGIKKGYTPATTNIGKLVGLEWEAATRAHQSREMFKTLHNIGAEKGVEIQLMKHRAAKPIRMVERWDLLGKQGLTEDYVRYSHPALDKMIRFKDTNGTLVKLKGAVGVRKELFPFVKAYLESPNYGSLSKLNFATKSLKLGFSMFHVMSLGMQEIANFRIPFKNIPRGLKELKSLSPEVRLLHQEGLELFKGYEDIGYRNKFFEGAETWKKAGNFVTKPIEAMRTFIFDIVQPGMKTSFAVDQYNTLLPKYLKKGLTKEQCARDVVKAADGHFSGEHYKRSLLETNRFMARMYFSPQARKTWQAALLSPTWQREHLLVAKNVAKSFMPDRFIRKLGLSEIGPIKGEFRKYLLGATLLIGGVDLWNMYLTQKMDGEAKHLWQNPSGKGFAIRAPWNEPGYTTTDKAGKERRVKGGPGYIRPLKSVFEVAEWVKTPFKKFIYKLSPIVTATGRQFWPSKYQKEYKGWPDMPRRVKDFVLDVGTPISAAQISSWAMGKKTPQAAAIPFFGFPTSKLSIKQTNRVYYGRLAAIQKKHGRYSDEWRKVKAEFEDMGYKFTEKSYRAYLQEKKEPKRGLLGALRIP